MSLEGQTTEMAEQGTFSEAIEETQEETSQESSSEESSQKEDEFSSKFAALSRKEKAIRDRESDYEAKMAEYEEKLAEMNREPEKEPELPLEYRLQKNPIETLEELGLSYEQLTDIVLNDGKISTDMQLKLMRQDIDKKYEGKLEKLERELEERDKNQEQQKYDEAVDNFKFQLDDFVATNEDYELIQANDASSLVFEVIEEHYNDTGRVLDMKEAADSVESHLETELRKVLEKSKKLGQWKAKDEEPEEEERQSPSPTLSNALSSQAQYNEDRTLTHDQSKAKAASLLKWTD